MIGFHALFSSPDSCILDERDKNRNYVSFTCHIIFVGNMSYVFLNDLEQVDMKMNIFDICVIVACLPQMCEVPTQGPTCHDSKTRERICIQGVERSEKPKCTRVPQTGCSTSMSSGACAQC